MRIRLAALLAVLSGCEPSPTPVLVVSTPAIAMPFCTRTLGLPECFAEPSTLPDRPAGLSDIPVRMHRQPAPWWCLFD